MSARAIGVFAIGIASCSSGGDDTKSTAVEDTAPHITGCNSVRYMGCTYGDIGCEPGIASFDATITVSNCHAAFHVVCSAGCVASVTPH